MHALETAEHLKLAEFDHLQQNADLLSAIHDQVRNEPMFVADRDTTLRDPNNFYVQNTTKNVLHQGPSIFEVNDQHFTKTVAREVGYFGLYQPAICSE